MEKVDELLDGLVQAVISEQKEMGGAYGLDGRTCHGDGNESVPSDGGHIM